MANHKERQPVALSDSDSLPSLRICHANQSSQEALAHGDCVFCGNALKDHSPITWIEYHTEFQSNPATGITEPVKVAGKTVTRRIDIHHLIWQCVAGELGEKWPPDDLNGVWVGYGCHREYHRRICKEVSSPHKWTLQTYQKYVAERDFGILSLNAQAARPNLLLVPFLSSVIAAR